MSKSSIFLVKKKAECEEECYATLFKVLLNYFFAVSHKSVPIKKGRPQRGSKTRLIFIHGNTNQDLFNGSRNRNHWYYNWHIDFDKTSNLYTNLVKLNLKESIECINVDIRQTFNMIIHSQPARLTCCDNS